MRTEQEKNGRLVRVWEVTCPERETETHAILCTGCIANYPAEVLTIGLPGLTAYECRVCGDSVPHGDAHPIGIDAFRRVARRHAAKLLREVAHELETGAAGLHALRIASLTRHGLQTGTTIFQVAIHRAEQLRVTRTDSA